MASGTIEDLLDGMEISANGAIEVLKQAHELGLQVTKDEFFTLESRAGRNHAPWLLISAHLWGVITDEVLTLSIGGVWAIVEHPHEALTRQDWLHLFAAAGFTVDGKSAERPRGPITLYRGCTPGRTRGFSWTSDPEVARWFAERPGQRQAAVYTAAAPAESLLCIPGTEGRPGEAEHVINPAGLRIRRATMPERAVEGAQG